MKPLLLVSLLAAAAVSAQTLPGKVRYASTAITCSAGTCDGSAPATSDTSGISIQQATAYRVRVCADSGKVLQGAGTLDAYVQDEVDGLWTRVPQLDLTVPGGAASKRCYGWAEFENGVPYGRVFYLASGVTVDAGNLTVRLYVTTARK